MIQTRFMQEQPHLVHLGKARLEIFKTITLPTVIKQTSQDFIWIIRTDPMLNETIREPLVELLADCPNHVLVASNSNPEGFRGDAAVADISRDVVWSGSYDLIHEYHRCSANTNCTGKSFGCRRRYSSSICRVYADHGTQVSE